MENNVKELPLSKYKGGSRSSVYTGRPQGELARNDLKLSQLDANTIQIRFVIPAGTTAITPSFFLGLLFDSIKKMGFDQYKVKYSFRFEEEDPEIVGILQSNIAEGERNAFNTL